MQIHEAFHIFIHVNIWQNPLQYCKIISLQLIKINEKKEIEKKSLLERPISNCSRVKGVEILLEIFLRI